MKIKYLCALLLAALTYSCDDTTPGIGDTTIPDGDHIQAGGKIYDVTTRSILADSVYALLIWDVIPTLSSVNSRPTL